MNGWRLLCVYAPRMRLLFTCIYPQMIRVSIIRAINIIEFISIIFFKFFDFFFYSIDAWSLSQMTEEIWPFYLTWAWFDFGRVIFINQFTSCSLQLRSIPQHRVCQFNCVPVFLILIKPYLNLISITDCYALVFTTPHLFVDNLLFLSVLEYSFISSNLVWVIAKTILSKQADYFFFAKVHLYFFNVFII